MTDSARYRPQMNEQEMEALTVLTLRYLDHDCDTDDVAKLKTALASAAGRARFVALCRLQGELHEVYAPRRADLLARRLSAGQSAGAMVSLGRKTSAAGGARSSAAPAAKTVGAPASDPELPLDSPDADPCADTVMRELSPEDTAHPAPPPTTEIKTPLV